MRLACKQWFCKIMKKKEHLYFTLGSKTISSRFSPLFTKFNLLHNFKGLVHCSTNYSETDFLTSTLQQSTLRTCIVIMKVLFQYQNKDIWFEVFVNWLSSNAREYSLLCYLIHNWCGKHNSFYADICSSTYTCSLHIIWYKMIFFQDILPV